ncbi:MAG: cytochrome ubiquinol oxidase subunit I [Sulfuricurvum sp.]|uniref:cytochrome ubiquinol oxidase subunit I n=1 Tax=Sulfuricurvum sp. TaxID=2025608 RepID=UPI003D0C02D5
MELVDWSRAQFALTAIYHFLFVPLTLGLSFLVAIMETIYLKTGDEKWLSTTKFWVKLFGINFVIGVATGLIMEFEFGTNWAAYSWIVGDIFGAPLAIEGIFAFFLESTFFVVLFFGWNRVSKRFHLLSSWLVAIGTNLSALWILVANGWMQHPVGMNFNPDAMRYEMGNFWDVIFSPVAVAKFLHTIGGGYVTAAIFVVGVSAWFLIRGRETQFARRSIIVGASFGLFASIFLLLSGDESAHQVAQKQPMKLAAMEGLYTGEGRAGIVAFGILNPDKEIGDDKPEFFGDIQIPYALSILGYHDINAFVPGINDLISGNSKFDVMSAGEKIARGQSALSELSAYHDAKKAGDTETAAAHLRAFDANESYMGYGHFTDPKQTVPPIALTFYSFHLMVGLGSFFIVLFIVLLYLSMTNELIRVRWALWITFLSIPLGFIACEAGWIVAEVGRQPWVIQDLLPTMKGVSALSSQSVQITFWMFAALFTALLIAEVKIMVSAIAKGPHIAEKGDDHV